MAGLLDAVMAGDAVRIRSLVDTDSLDLNAPDQNGQTALSRASGADQVASIEELIALGARVDGTDQNGQTALFAASRENSVNAIRALVDRGARVEAEDKNGQTALFAASRENSVNAIRAIVDRGARVDAEDKNGQTALFMAARRGMVNAIHTLLHRDANVNHRDNSGRTALFAASQTGQVDAICALVERGAKVDAKDENQQTALSEASRKNQVNAIAALVNTHRLSVNITDGSGRTALFEASKTGSMDAIFALVGLGGDVDHTDGYGRTALFEASLANQVDSIEALVNVGANVNKEGRDGSTAFDVANEHGLKDVVSALKSQGATHRDTFASSLSEKGIFERKRLQLSISLDEYWTKITQNRDRSQRKPRDIALSYFYDNGDIRMIVAFRKGWVGSVYRDPTDGTFPCFSEVEADSNTHLQSVGIDTVLYTREGKVYKNGIDLRQESGPLTNIPSSTRLGCFAQNGDDFYIVKSVVPLRIMKVTGTSCEEIEAREKCFAKYSLKHVVKKKYPNLVAIENMLVDQNQGKEGIFGVATAGIMLDREHLFVGHATVMQGKGDCFPNYLVHSLSEEKKRGQMHYMFFYTIAFDSGMVRLSRMTSCFQPPPSTKETFHKMTVPTGLSSYGEQFLVSFGRAEQTSWVTSYPKNEIQAMLAPVDSWNDDNYVFHPSYAESLRTARNVSMSTWNNLIGTNKTGLIGTTVTHGGRFNPAIASFGGHDGTFVTAWRKFNGNVEEWKGYNQVAMETCSLKIEGGKLVYTRESEVAEFQVGTTAAGGEDPRLITENGCPLMFINDLNASQQRRMYVHNLLTDKHMMTTLPFCKNLLTFPRHENNKRCKEKNWGPFYHEGLLHFVQSVNPFKVGKVGDAFKCPSSPAQAEQECGSAWTHVFPQNLAPIVDKFGVNFRGGTPGVPVGEGHEAEYLFVGHSVITTKETDCFPDFVVDRMMGKTTEATDHQKKYRKMYMSFFYTIGQKVGTVGRQKGVNMWEMKRLSCCSHLPGKNQNFSKIQFPAGLAKAKLGREFGDAFVVSFGDEDRYGGFCAVNREFLNAVLRPVADWNVGNYVFDINYFQNVLNVTN